MWTNDQSAELWHSDRMSYAPGRLHFVKQEWIIPGSKRYRDPMIAHLSHESSVAWLSSRYEFMLIEEIIVHKLLSQHARGQCSSGWVIKPTLERIQDIVGSGNAGSHDCTPSIFKMWAEVDPERGYSLLWRIHRRFIISRGQFGHNRIVPGVYLIGCEWLIHLTTTVVIRYGVMLWLRIVLAVDKMILLFAFIMLFIGVSTVFSSVIEVGDAIIYSVGCHIW